MRNIYELEVIDYQIEAKFFGLDKIESDVRITIQGTQPIVQLASVSDKPGFIKLTDLTKISITVPSVGKLSHIKALNFEILPALQNFVTIFQNFNKSRTAGAKTNGKFICRVYSTDRKRSK